MTTALSPTEWKARFDKAKTNRGDLNDRMKDDRSLYNMDDYKWETTTKTHEPVDVDIVTLNDPRFFADRVKDTCAGSKVQYEIEDGNEKVNDDKSSPIEDWLRLCLEASDERLMRGEKLPLKVASAGHLTISGRIPVRILMRMNGDEFVPDIQWYDPLYTYYQPSYDGLVWEAPVMTRTAEEIFDEYGITIKGDDAEVIDLWTKTDEHIFIDGKLEKTNPNKMGYVPFINAVAPIGGFLLDKGFSKYVGESVYAPVRNLYKVLNRLLTIEATTARMAMEGAYQYESEAGEKAEITEYPVVPGGVTAVEPGGGFKLIPINDIKQATMHCISLIEARIQRATLPFIDYGQTPFELSGSAMMMVKGAGDIIYMPRLIAMEYLYTQMCKMLIRQMIDGGIKAELGEGPYKMKLANVDLKGDYSLNVKFSAELPEEEQANLYRAKVYKELGLSQDTVIRRGLGMDNPDEEQFKALTEKARDMIPALWLRDAAKGYIQRDDQNAAKTVAAQLKISLDQLLKGQMVAPSPDGERGVNIPAQFGEGQRGGRPLQQATMPEPPREKEAVNV